MRPRLYRYSPAEVLAVYVNHPLSLTSLQARLERQGKSGQLREVDLAFDAETETIDQNHIGAAPFVLELAEATGVRASDTVLDLGCGIGGPARLLGDRFGCRVHGVDLSPGRIGDAVKLTELTGLSESVTFECADMNALSPEPRYTVVWGQNSWIHIPDREALLATASAWLLPEGRVAFEDVCIARPLLPERELQWFDAISDAWRSTFASVAEWEEAFERAGLSVKVSVDRSQPFIEHYRKLVQLADAAPEKYPAHEAEGWRCAKWLGESGAFCFHRIVGVKQ